VSVAHGILEWRSNTTALFITLISTSDEQELHLPPKIIVPNTTSHLTNTTITASSSTLLTRLSKLHKMSSSNSTMFWNPSSTKDYSSALGSLTSTYGTSGSTPTPVHLTSKSKSSSGRRRDGLSPPPPTPSQSCTTLIHDESRRSSVDSQRTLTSDSDINSISSSSDIEDTFGQLLSQYGLGSFGAGMPVPTIHSSSSSKPKPRRKSRKDNDSLSSGSMSKVGSLLSRYGFGGSSRDSR